jgi:hypothetical protein
MFPSLTALWDGGAEIVLNIASMCGLEMSDEVLDAVRLSRVC